jgi:transcriptional antiterminator NusG
MTEEKTSTTTKWVTLKVIPGRERTVSERLKTEMKRERNEDIRILIPTEKIWFIKDGKKVAREKTMYPGYVFLETDHVGELKFVIKSITGASGLILDRDGEAVYLKQRDVDKMIGEVETTKKDDGLISFVVGESITIVGGSFDNFKGNVESIDYDKSKLKVSVLIFGRPTVIDVDMSSVNKIL